MTRVIDATVKWCRPLLRVSPQELSITRRGFHPGTPQSRERRERIAEVVLFGYHAGLEHEADGAPLAERLFECGLEDAGFAIEGAAMALALLDGLDPFSRRRRVQSFLAGCAGPYECLVAIGVGCAVARLPWLRSRAEAVSTQFDWRLRWLVLDGYGFHEGFFSWNRIKTGRLPRGVYGYAARAFDQGIGRSVWFVEGCDPSRVAAAIAAFPPTRQSDLWSGVGVACAYAGGAPDAAVGELVEAAGPHRAAVAQGVAFAAEARQMAGNPARHTDASCRVACDRSAADAVAIVDEAVATVTSESVEPAYELVRTRVQAAFSRVPV